MQDTRILNLDFNRKYSVIPYLPNLKELKCNGNKVRKVHFMPLLEECDVESNRIKCVKKRLATIVVWYSDNKIKDFSFLLSATTGNKFVARIRYEVGSIYGD
jgi:hypothetical protein